ncbi:MAG: GIY-YIG nuclease family protein [Flavobacteriales bacterium]|nr:GIY-YIG nuclease family protein [Flavobacteriales bacterium]
MEYIVYALFCSDGAYYTGCTHNLEDRLDRHNRGSMPATKNRRPVQLVSYTACVAVAESYEIDRRRCNLRRTSGLHPAHVG